ncbi:MAG: fumarylacetoacetate hydrolase family protein, partial [Bryobacteraceae bacterium]
WVESANQPACDFPIQNLPFGIFRTDRKADRVGTAIGDFVLDLSECFREGLLTGVDVTFAPFFQASYLNPLMTLNPAERAEVRLSISRLLRAGSRKKEHAEKFLTPIHDALLLRPTLQRGYTDFYASIHHATRVGQLFRPDQPLLPNYKWVPIAYHGRASTLMVSGTPVRRPNGQTKAPDAAEPSFGPSRRLDYELEVGFYGAGLQRIGEAVPIAKAEEHIFGMEALAPFRIPAFERAPDDPRPMPYLLSDDDQRDGGVDITLEVLLASARMQQESIAPVTVSRGNFRDMYWTMAQMVAHHTSNGCNLMAGDLLASGTVSGPERESAGCLLELTEGGKRAIPLPTGEERRFLEDGDEVILRGWCERPGYRRIGLGECRGLILPAASLH